MKFLLRHLAARVCANFCDATRAELFLGLTRRGLHSKQDLSNLIPT
jgi:hypothetical protein